METMAAVIDAHTRDLERRSQPAGIQLSFDDANAAARVGEPVRGTEPGGTTTEDDEVVVRGHITGVSAPSPGNTTTSPMSCTATRSPG